MSVVPISSKAICSTNPNAPQTASVSLESTASKVKNQSSVQLIGELPLSSSSSSSAVASATTTTLQSGVPAPSKVIFSKNLNGATGPSVLLESSAQKVKYQSPVQQPASSSSSASGLSSADLAKCKSDAHKSSSTTTATTTTVAQSSQADDVKGITSKTSQMMSQPQAEITDKNYVWEGHVNIRAPDGRWMPVAYPDVIRTEVIEVRNRDRNGFGSTNTTVINTYDLDKRVIVDDFETWTVDRWASWFLKLGYPQHQRSHSCVHDLAYRAVSGVDYRSYGMTLVKNVWVNASNKKAIANANAVQLPSDKNEDSGCVLC